jgi:multicomponent Na+:H+ antiporter subunit E
MDRTVWTAFIHRLLFTSGVWVVLGGIDAKALAVGAFAVPAATWLSLRLLPLRQHLVLRRLVRHFPAFAGNSLIGGLDVARRALAPRMPLSPGWVEVPVRLHDGGRVAMGAELSLMPGTLAAGVRGDRLLVHLLDTEAGFERAIPREEAAIAAMILEAGPSPTDAERAP